MKVCKANACVHRDGGKEKARASLKQHLSENAQASRRTRAQTNNAPLCSLKLPHTLTMDNTIPVLHPGKLMQHNSNEEA